MGKINKFKKKKELLEQVNLLQKQLNEIRNQLKQFNRDSSPESIISSTQAQKSDNFNEFIARHILKQHPKFKLIIIKKRNPNISHNQ